MPTEGPAIESFISPKSRKPNKYSVGGGNAFTDVQISRRMLRWSAIDR